jgi:hypothetical protein
MSPELENYYFDRFDMMSKKGWKDLIEDAQKMKEAYDKVESLTNVDELWYAKGRLDILNWLITLKETSDEAYKELSEND